MCDRLRVFQYTGLILVLVLLGCAPADSSSPRIISRTEEPPDPPTSEDITAVEEIPVIPDLNSSEKTSLGSLTRVDDYPLYTMRYTANYRTSTGSMQYESLTKRSLEWACSLFAAFGDAQNALYGRNFDWENSPALLLFTDPPDGFSSVSMVDLAFFVPEEKLDHLTDLPLEQRIELLEAPYWPFDGMNEHGLVVGMAAVPDSRAPVQPNLEWIGSLGIIREMLDRARNVGEAVEVAQSFNISFEGGPHIHYLVADASGQAVLIELYDGVFRQHLNKGPWHAATNFTVSSVSGSPEGRCWRYDALTEYLTKSNGWLTQSKAMELLSEVAQQNTQWSIVYGLSTQSISVVLGREYQRPHLFSLSD